VARRSIASLDFAATAFTTHCLPSNNGAPQIMAAPMAANTVLDREFLKTRAKILEIGAILDRIDRAEGDVGPDRRRDLLRQGIEVLLDDETGRAERIQMLFSLPYREKWQKDFGLA
jgi:hypothetical protein